MTTQTLLETAEVRPDSTNGQLDRTLVVGNLARWQSEGRMTDALDEFHFVGFDELTPKVIDAFQPDIILSPLFDDDFDVMDVATTLINMGFEGRYRAITDALPNAGIVRCEVRNHAPGLDFDLLIMGAQDAG
jgi:hypothetical protein